MRTRQSHAIFQPVARDDESTGLTRTTTRLGSELANAVDDLHFEKADWTQEPHTQFGGYRENQETSSCARGEGETCFYDVPCASA